MPCIQLFVQRHKILHDAKSRKNVESWCTESDTFDPKKVNKTETAINNEPHVVSRPVDDALFCFVLRDSL